MKGILRTSTPTHTVEASKVQVRTNIALGSLEKRPRVTFKTVEFHIHALILGDNPAVSVGPPLSIGWEAVASVILDLDAYETSRPPRQDSSDLVVPRAMRVDWLREEGCARSEMARVENEIKVIKKHRLRNAPGLWERVQMRDNYGTLGARMLRSELARVENEIKVIKKHRLRNARKGLWGRVQMRMPGKLDDRGTVGVKVIKKHRLRNARKGLWERVQMRMPGKLHDRGAVGVKVIKEHHLRNARKGLWERVQMRVRMLEGYDRREMARVENEIKAIKKHSLKNPRKGLWKRAQEVFQHSNDRSPSVKKDEDRLTFC
jgi:hypothetical protein